MTFSFMTGLSSVVDSSLTFDERKKRKEEIFFILLTMIFYLFAYRCGRLTQHISLPYSIIGQGHVESAIKDTYCKRICGECTHEV